MKQHYYMKKDTNRNAGNGSEKIMRKCDMGLWNAEIWLHAMKKAAIMLLAGMLSLNAGGLLKVEAAAGKTDMENRILLADAETEVNIETEAVAETGVDAEAGGDTADSAGGSVEDDTTDSEPYFDGWVQDDAGLLTMEEEEALEEECERLFQTHDTGVYIITTPNFGGGDIKDWQRKIFSQYDLGADSAGSGVMLAISMAERDWGLVGFGTAQEAFSTYARERLGSLILDDLSEGEFYKAFSGYLSIADDCLSAAEEGNPYTEQHRYREGWRFPVIFGVSFLLSLGISAAVVLTWKKGMNTRVRQKGAMEYLKEGSFYLSNKSDLFLYHTVNRTKRPKQDSSSGSSGMHSDHSGTSGKF